MYSDNESGASAWSGTPTQTGGVFRGVSSGVAPSVQLLYQGIDGALNTIGRSGVTTPIDASRYRRLSFRARRSVGTPDVQDRVAAFWFPNTSQAGGGFALWQARGTLPGSQHANMMPQAAQSGATYQIYRVDLDVPLQGSGAAWSRPDPGPQGPPRLVGDGAERHLRPRLDPPDRARQQRRDPPPAVERHGRPRRAARHPRAVGRRHPDLSRGHHRRRVDFADNSFLDWDYGYLPPGTWTITAQGSGASRTVTLNIDAAPVVSVLDPDAEGGRDFATTVIGDAWDLTNVQDVQRNHASLHHLTSATFDENGLLGVTRGGSYASGCAADTCPDPFVQFLDDGFGFGPAVDRRQHLPPAVVHARLRPPRADDRPGAQRHLGRRRARRVGGVRRHRLHAVSPSRRTSSSSTAARPASRWTWRRSTTRTDARGARSPRCGRARSARSASTSTRARRRAPSASSNVKLTADDAPNGSGFFPIRWRIADATFTASVANTGGGDATIALYYDTDLNPATEDADRRRASTPRSGLYYWNMAGLAPGVYYVYAQSSPTAPAASQGRYSTGPVRVGATIPAADRRQRQRPRRCLGDASTACRTRAADDDGDGVDQPGRVPGRHAPAPVEHLDAAGRRDRLLRRAHRARQPRFDARRRHAHLPAAGAEPADHAQLLAAAVRAHDRRRQRGRRPRARPTCRR